MNRITRQPWWPWAKRGLTLLFFGLVAVLIFRQARGIDWAEVSEAVRNTSRADLLLAALLAAASHALYSGFDLFGRHITGHRLPVPRVMATTFVSYVFNLNLGSLIGGLGFRYRLYARQGLDTATITTVAATSMATNWLGFAAVAGPVLLLQPPALPEGWALAGGPLRAVGALLCTLPIAWLIVCARATRREWQWREHRLALPSLRIGALQLAVASINWLLMGGVVWLLLGRELAYPLVLGTLLIAAVAGVLTHVPAGLGVLEAVFIALLGTQASHGALIGGLLLYRAMYYLAPLGLAVALHTWLEARSGISEAPGRIAQPALDA